MGHIVKRDLDGGHPEKVVGRLEQQRGDILTEEEQTRSVDFRRLDEPAPGLEVVGFQRIARLVPSRRADHGLDDAQSAQAPPRDELGRQGKRLAELFRRISGIQVDETSAEVAAQGGRAIEDARHVKARKFGLDELLVFLIGEGKLRELPGHLVGHGLHPGLHEPVLHQIRALGVPDERPRQISNVARPEEVFDRAAKRCAGRRCIAHDRAFRGRHQRERRGIGFVKGQAARTVGLGHVDPPFINPWLQRRPAGDTSFHRLSTFPRITGSSA